MWGRVITAVVAVAAIFWLGAMERNQRLLASGVAASGRLRVAGNVRRAEADLRDARFLNPDTAPNLARAFMRYGDGRPRGAATLANEIVRQEPANVRAWSLLVRLSTGQDATSSRRASAALRRLDPIDFDASR
jgi:hypothetical protein